MLPPLLLLFSMTLMGFVLLANQVFGAYLRDFSDLLRSTRRVLLMLLGNVSLSELEDVDRAWTVLVRCSSCRRASTRKLTPTPLPSSHSP